MDTLKEIGMNVIVMVSSVVLSVIVIVIIFYLILYAFKSQLTTAKIVDFFFGG